MKLTSHFSWFIVHVVFCIYIYAILSKFTKDMQDAPAYTGEPWTKQTCKRDDLPNLHHDSEVVVKVQYCLDLFGGFTPLRNWEIWIIFDGICHSHCRRQPEWVVNWYADIKHPCCLVKFSCLLVKFQSNFCPFCPTIVPGTKANQGTSPGSEGVIHHALDSVKNLLIGHQLLQFQVIQLGSADVKIGWAWFLPRLSYKFPTKDHPEMLHSNSFPKLMVNAAQVQQTIGCSRAFRTEVLSALSRTFCAIPHSGISNQLLGWLWGMIPSPLGGWRHSSPARGEGGAQLFDQQLLSCHGDSWAIHSFLLIQGWFLWIISWLICGEHRSRPHQTLTKSFMPCWQAAARALAPRISLPTSSVCRNWGTPHHQTSNGPFKE